MWVLFSLTVLVVGIVCLRAYDDWKHGGNHGSLTI